MPLYFVEHKHAAETCPTKDRNMMAMLGQHVSQENASKFGITIQTDVVHPGEHRLNMVLVASDQSKIDEFMKPFGMVGSVAVKEVHTCEQVVETGQC
jgi:hypothetical protein